MIITLDNAKAKVFIEKLRPNKEFTALVSQYENQTKRWGTSEFEIDLTKQRKKLLDRLYATAKELGDRSIMMQISALLNVRALGTKAKITMINTLREAIVRYLVEGMKDGWVYYKREDGIFVPFVVTKVHYTPPRGSGTDRAPAYVTVYLSANVATTNTSDEGYKSSRSRGVESSTAINFTTEDLRAGGDKGSTVADLFTRKNFFKETDELRAMYDEQMAKFLSVIQAPNAQFLFSGNAVEVSKDTNSWYRSRDVEIPKTIRVINDETKVRRAYSEAADPEFWRQVLIEVNEGRATDEPDDTPEGEEPPEEGWEEDVLDTEKKGFLRIETGFDTTPTHPMALIFDLDKHRHLWVHTDYLVEYAYKPEMKDHLVLPQDHRDMIDILATDFESIAEDVVEGKGGGTMILCSGKPGLGKTLTPEIYCEVIGRPHYRVTAGVLGTKPEDVEKNLKRILDNAQRWGAVLTLDEADVYIRTRGDDVTHNAIVAAFLQQLEYFSGIVFMTTNRENDTDDAIISRCAALIRYHTPEPEDALKIWGIQSKLCGMDLSAALIQELANHFDTASGRDIRNLCRTAAKWFKAKKETPNFEGFRKIAQFRGL